MSKPSWDFTSYDLNLVEKLRPWESEVKRLRVSKEVCPTTGKEHLQCTVTFKRTYRFSAVKKLLPTCHIEEKKACADDLYCMKTDSEILINVDNRQQGKRNDLIELRDMVDNNCNKLEMFQAHFGTMVRNYRGIYEYRNLLNAKRCRTKPEVIWCIGPSKGGKSTWAQNTYPDAYWATAEHGDKLWWDGYDQQETVVLDDFCPSMISYHGLLKLLNGTGKYRVPTKGGSDWFLSKRVILTSVVHPRQMYVNTWDYQLERRITRFQKHWKNDDGYHHENVTDVTEVSER